MATKNKYSKRGGDAEQVQEETEGTVVVKMENSTNFSHVTSAKVHLDHPGAVL